MRSRGTERADGSLHVRVVARPNRSTEQLLCVTLQEIDRTLSRTLIYAAYTRTARETEMIVAAFRLDGDLVDAPAADSIRVDAPTS
jgi:hypothetical protein